LDLLLLRFLADPRPRAAGLESFLWNTHFAGAAIPLAIVCCGPAVGQIEALISRFSNRITQPGRLTKRQM
jgi:hypothetical protein